jgi:TolB-like protein
VIYEAIFNREPVPASQLNPALPPDFGRILDKALEKDRTLRYQTATELKTDLIRLKRDLDSGRRRASDDSRGGRPAEKSIAVLYLENLGGMKEDEYFRDGITEDIITELSKIKGLKIFPRPTVLGYRDKSVTPQQVGRELNASYVLGGSLRRAGSRVRITAQLMDAHTDFPVWSERYDREMKDIFEVQDEIARKIAEALRITLTPQEQEAIAAKPTLNHQAYDLYLNGKSYARRRTRQDLEYALRMFENAVTLDPRFALAYAAIANVCAQSYYHYHRDAVWTERALAASQRAVEIQADLPEVQVAQSWIAYAEGRYDDAIRSTRHAIERKRDCEGGYYLLLRVLFAAGRYQDVVNEAEAAIEAAADDYNVYVPIENSLKKLGKEEMLRNIVARRAEALDGHLIQVPEDARARTHLAIARIYFGRIEEGVRELNLAMALRPNDAMVLYNAACVFSMSGRRAESLTALGRAWDAGYKDAVWARRDPDLTPLHGDPDFERLFPEPAPRV